MDQPQNNDCFACGSTLRMGSKFCVQCGAKCERFAGHSDDDTFVTATFDDGSFNSHGTSFCPNCGKVPVTRPAGKYCRACGHSLAKTNPERPVNNGFEAVAS